MKKYKNSYKFIITSLKVGPESPTGMHEFKTEAQMAIDTEASVVMIDDYNYLDYPNWKRQTAL